MKHSRFRRSLSWALSLILILTVSCGKDRGGSGSAADPNAKGTLPVASDSSGWFASRGPERLEDFRDLSIGSDAGFTDVQAAGSDLWILSNGGAVYRAHSGSADPVFFPGLSEDSRARAFAAEASAVFVSEEGGAVHAFRPPQGTGEEEIGGSRVWSSMPGFVPDWLLAVDGYLVCSSSNGMIGVLSASDGSVVAFLDLGISLAARPAAAGTVLVVPKIAGLAALRLPKLEFLWSGLTAPAAGGQLRTIKDSLAFQDSEGPLRVLEAETGKERYMLPAGKGAAAACDGERWYIAGAEGSLGAFSFSDGVPIWTAGSSRVEKSTKTEASRFQPRIAAGEGRLYLAGAEGLEAWDSQTGELLERSPSPSWVDGLYMIPGQLYARLRGGVLRLYGRDEMPSAGPDLETRVRPEPKAAERIASRLEKYAEPGTPVSVAWRAYVSEAAPSPDSRFTVFLLEVREAGKRVFTLRPDDAEKLLVSVFDSNGEERNSNVGELGVDVSFEQWLEQGTWYVATGPLRGIRYTDHVFLEIR